MAKLDHQRICKNRYVTIFQCDEMVNHLIFYSKIALWPINYVVKMFAAKMLMAKVSRTLDDSMVPISDERLDQPTTLLAHWLQRFSFLWLRN